MSYKKKYSDTGIIEQANIKANYSHPAYSLNMQDLQNEINKIKNDKIKAIIEDERLEDNELER